MKGFKGIKYANIVLNRMKNATFKDEAEENAVRGAAYFQRVYRYYKLTHLLEMFLIPARRLKHRKWIPTRATVRAFWNR